MREGVGQAILSPALHCCISRYTPTMIRAVRRGILLVFFCLLAGAETLDDAVAALAKKIAARLGPAVASPV